VDCAPEGLPRPWTEFLGISLLAIGGLMLGGLLSYQFGTGALMGPVGRLVAAALYTSFGMAAYLVTLGVLGVGIKALVGQRMEIRIAEGIGFTVATLAGCVLLHVMFPRYRVHGYTAGGLTGELAGEISLGLFHHAGTYLVALAAICLGLLASTPLSTRHLIAALRMVGVASRAVGVYMWEGVASIIRAQEKPLDSDRAHEEEDAAERASDEHDEDEYYEEEDDYDEECDEEWAETEEDEEDEETEEGDEDAEEGEEDTAEDAEEDEEAAVAARQKTDRAFSPTPKAQTGARQRARKRQKQEEEPEIVVSSEIEQGTPSAADRDAAEVRARLKKAPPRPEQLDRPAPSTNAAAAEPRPETGVTGITRLVDEPWEFPPLELFEAVDKVKTEVDRGLLKEQAKRLESALAEFKIQGKVTKIHPGPVVTRYELKPEAGVKLSRIENLENDMAMALEAIRIRILAPIPGTSSVGFEVPNRVRETVYVKEILEDEGFGEGGKAKLPVALGKDITGKPVSIDLAMAPHLLVAGATGAGKSVGLNSMISSLLYTRSPEDVRMIMIDPKMLELSMYEGIAHLLLPVVTDPEKANLALRWAVEEMDRRYSMLSAARVRDIIGYNRKIPRLVEMWEAEKKVVELEAAQAALDAAREGEDAVAGAELPGVVVDAEGNQEPVFGGVELPEKPTRLPYVVIVIDEFADLMMVASKEVEQNVSRIAAKARAAGIHLIVATQRPSVDVITGTIKNNFPSRIAFQVTSEADSRTILDGKGAKQLLGMGDMLHMDRGHEPLRVHGCFVSEDEIFKVVKFVKRQAKPIYNMEIVRKRDGDRTEDEPPQKHDPLFDMAVQIVAEEQRVSTSRIQRKLNVGYNRAAKIVERMEEDGLIGPPRGTTPREVFVSPGWSPDEAA
jgi:S-DNA-T family DNA segregation ATPase FtsK/SpoIIIE